MRKQLDKIAVTLLAAAALTLTFIGCSSDSDNGDYPSPQALSSSSDGKQSDSNSSSSEKDSQSSSNEETSSSSDIEDSSSSSSALKECTKEFNPNNTFCYDDVLYQKCGGEEYNPTNQRCGAGNVIEIKCGTGSNYFNPETHFCNGNYVAIKCIGEEYDTSLQYCSGNQVVDYLIFTDSRDGKKYKYVAIGDQAWMAENLNYDAAGSKCYGENVYGFTAEVQANCEKYGRLYDWATAMGLDESYNSMEWDLTSQRKGVCPDGWHLPSNAEWDALYKYVDSDYEVDYDKDYGHSLSAGKHLKATSGWGYSGFDGTSCNGTDDFGFAALPGSFGTSSGSFGDDGYDGFWWSASERNGNSAYRWEMGCSEAAYEGSFNKKYLLSIRCVKD